MQAGSLRRRVTIETPGTGQNQFGEPVETWNPFAVVSASQEDLTGREWYAAQQVRADVTTRFGMRYLDGVTASMRLVSEGVTYNVASVADPDGRRRSLTVLAVKVG